MLDCSTAEVSWSKLDQQGSLPTSERTEGTKKTGENKGFFCMHAHAGPHHGAMNIGMQAETLSIVVSQQTTGIEDKGDEYWKDEKLGVVFVYDQ